MGAKRKIGALYRYAPVKWKFGDDIANDSIMTMEHHRRQLARLGKLRDAATGERREALNDALRLMMAERRFTRIEMGTTPEFPKVEKKAGHGTRVDDR